MTRSQLLGVPEEVLIAVDLDLEAARQGPRTLDSVLDGVHPEEITARYRELLGRHSYTTRRHGRRDWEDFALAEAADERARLLRRHA